MKRLYIDFDGVIMDTIPYLYAAVEESKIDINNESAIREFYSHYNFNDIVNDKNILNDSINCIYKLIDSGLFEISILTHVNSLDEGVVKTNYLRKYFKSITIILVPKEISKTKMIHSKDAILVDDYSGNLKEWSDSGGIPIRFNSENNTKGYTTITCLDELINIFKGDEL